MSSRNDAASKGSRNFVSSSSPICAGWPKPARKGAPAESIAFRPDPSVAIASSTKSATAKTTATVRCARLTGGRSDAGCVSPT